MDIKLVIIASKLLRLIVCKAFQFRANEGGSCDPQLENATFNDSTSSDLTANQRIGIFGGIVVLAIIITIIKAILSYVICLNASRNLHNKMFKAILRAPILFFDTNPVGELNECMFIVIAIITSFTNRSCLEQIFCRHRIVGYCSSKHILSLFLGWFFFRY